jgi:hypothetical protein
MKKSKATQSPPRVNNSTKIESNDSEGSKISDKELKIMIVRMINESKEVINEHLNKFQDNNKQLNCKRQTR